MPKKKIIFQCLIPRKSKIALSTELGRVAKMEGLVYVEAKKIGSAIFYNDTQNFATEIKISFVRAFAKP